jgi:SpoVK/Ycf46/Vps4 family AAA+-type ATPase
MSSKTETWTLRRVGRSRPALAWGATTLTGPTIARLREFANTARDRTAGARALFTGAAGTGKTLAAQVIATALGMDLWRIDLSALISKYIGETEKNLARLFAAAERAGIVLFFDEADALFGRRTEVKDSHDRYANQEVSFLLERLEQHPGVVILATNVRPRDARLLRRFRFVIDMPPRVAG